MTQNANPQQKQPADDKKTTTLAAKPLQIELVEDPNTPAKPDKFTKQSSILATQASIRRNTKLLANHLQNIDEV